MIAMRKTKSAILEAVYDTTQGLHKAGVMDQITLREFDRLCLVPVKEALNLTVQFCECVDQLHG